VNFERQCFNALRERLHCSREPGILLHHLDKEGGLLGCERRPFFARGMKGLPMFRVGSGMSRVAIGLAGFGTSSA
jgi:hypothetical protein